MSDFQKFEDGVGASRHGFYIVGDKKFYYKMNALINASSTKLPVQWNFNHSVFAAAAAKPRMDVPLSELYRLRCHQLRDQYDYVVLAYSGGSDSDTILKSFLKNKIRLDEIWFDQPFAFIQKSNYTPTMSTDSRNLASEWFYVVKPKIDQLQVSNPEIKIHVSDSTQDPSLEDFEDSHTLTLGYTYNSIKRWRYFKKYVEEIEKHKGKVCVIMGTDKCIPIKQQDQFGFSFVDNPTFAKHPFIEFFFWSPDMPEIVVQQAHQLWDHLKKNPKVLIRKTKNMIKDPNDWIQRDEYDQFIKSVIYPDWDLSTHQVDKQTVFLGTGYSIFVDRWAKEKFYQSWASNLKNTLRQIDPSVMYEDGQNFSGDIKAYYNFHPIGTFN